MSGPYDCVVKIVVGVSCPLLALTARTLSAVLRQDFVLYGRLIILLLSPDSSGERTKGKHRLVTCYKGDLSSAQFLAADAEASAIAAAAQEVTTKANPVFKARASPAPASGAKDSEVAPSSQFAAWNVTTVGPSSPVELEHIHIRGNKEGGQARRTAIRPWTLTQRVDDRSPAIYC